MNLFIKIYMKLRICLYSVYKCSKSFEYSEKVERYSGICTCGTLSRYYKMTCFRKNIDLTYPINTEFTLLQLVVVVEISLLTN